MLCMGRRNAVWSRLVQPNWTVAFQAVRLWIIPKLHRPKHWHFDPNQTSSPRRRIRLKTSDFALVDMFSHFLFSPILILLHESAGVFPRCAADGEPVDFQRRDADAYRYSLTVFAAGADAFIKFEIISDHRDAG